jgi:histidinol-phosphate aminotransferase
VKPTRWIRSEVLQSSPYSAGHGTAPIRLDRNESPEEVSEETRRAVLEALSKQPWSRYPDPYARELREAIGRRAELSPEAVLAGNGSNTLFLSLFVSLAAPGRRIALTPPTFGLYAPWVRSVGIEVVSFPLDDDTLEAPAAAMLQAAERDPELVFLLCRPNNPTGTVAPRSLVEGLLERGALVVVDEAYVEFAGESLADLLPGRASLLLVRTLSKASALAAARVGYFLGDPALLAQIEKMLVPYCVNLFARAAALASLADADSIRERVARIVAERERLFGRLRGLPGARLLASRTNFLYLRPERPAAELHEALRARGVLVRRVGGTSAEALRVTVGRRDENDLFFEAWKEVTA